MFTVTTSRNNCAKTVLYTQAPSAREVAWTICVFASIPYEELQEAFIARPALLQAVNDSALQGHPLGYSDDLLGVHFAVAGVEA